jgi:hypothetical protein
VFGICSVMLVVFWFCEFAGVLSCVDSAACVLCFLVILFDCLTAVKLVRLASKSAPSFLDSHICWYYLTNYATNQFTLHTPEIFVRCHCQECV